MEILKKSKLFEDFTEVEIRDFIGKNRGKIYYLGKDEAVFQAGDEPKSLFVLMAGSVQVEKLEKSGKRHIINRFYEAGTVFGEVYLYLKNHTYDYSCIVHEKAKILEIPRQGMEGMSKASCRIQNNMLKILANKAFYLNQKLLLHSSITLRQKIARYLLQIADERKYFKIPMTREEWADYIGTTRPSLSRELMEMQEEGFLEIEREDVKINRGKLEGLI
ncbi:MAG: Crp/Fnr family transcriptional regulator [Tissierellia bacterium]|nr:Crp/Fnr family transcriptional regulator [Tissierellia bacterium]